MTDGVVRSAEGEPWWPEFLELRHSVPLRELARRYGTNPRRLRRALQRSGEAEEPAALAAHVALLGTVPDAKLAEALNVTAEAVAGARRRRSVPAYTPPPRPPRVEREKKAPPRPRGPRDPEKLAPWDRPRERDWERGPAEPLSVAREPLMERRPRPMGGPTAAPAVVVVRRRSPAPPGRAAGQGEPAGAPPATVEQRPGTTERRPVETERPRGEAERRPAPFGRSLSDLPMPPSEVPEPGLERREDREGRRKRIVREPSMPSLEPRDPQPLGRPRAPRPRPVAASRFDRDPDDPDRTPVRVILRPRPEPPAAQAPVVEPRGLQIAVVRAGPAPAAPPPRPPQAPVYVPVVVARAGGVSAGAVPVDLALETPGGPSPELGAPEELELAEAHLAEAADLAEPTARVGTPAAAWWLVLADQELIVLAPNAAAAVARAQGRGEVLEVRLVEVLR